MAVSMLRCSLSTPSLTLLFYQPERLAGEQYSIRSDVWSTGITLLELVQNRFPFPNDLAQIELMMYITQNEASSLRLPTVWRLTVLEATRTWR